LVFTLSGRGSACKPVTTGGRHPTDSEPIRALRADARQNQERVLQVAAEAFAGKGTGASLKAIAQQAGVGVGTALVAPSPDQRALTPWLLGLTLGGVRPR